MKWRKMSVMVLAAVMVATAAGVSWAAFKIDTVPVGNAGNAGDTRYPDSSSNPPMSSFGSVA